MASITTTARSVERLEEMLEDLRVSGASRVAVMGYGRYDDVLFVACTEPDGEWRTLENPTGDGLEWRVGAAIGSLLNLLPPITIMFHSRHENAFEKDTR